MQGVLILFPEIKDQCPNEIVAQGIWVGTDQTDMLKIQLTAIIPMNTAHPIVRIMAAPSFLMTGEIL
jgi:hypothetical protein